MTDEPKPTYEELEVQIEQLRETNSRVRAQSDDNYNKGREWKDHAEKLSVSVKEMTQQIDAERREANAARTVSAELRGYIKRVHELDPKRVRKQREQRVEHHEMSQRDIDRAMRRGY